MWRAEHLDHPEFVATSQALESSLLLGPQDWSVYNDSCSQGTYTTRLMMTGCSDDEFTCSDGSCVSMSVRCDGKMDCQDGTDEAECKLLGHSLGYNKNLVPPPAKSGEKLSVNFDVKIFEIVHINEIDNEIEIKFETTRSWFDRRLTYHNMMENSKNKISSSDRKTIWAPWIIFQNFAGSDKNQRTDIPDALRIIINPYFNFTIGENNNMHNTHLFKGSENELKHVKERRTAWLCDFQMEWYPFDIQSCTMQFIIQDDSVIFWPKSVTYSGPKELPQHYVHDVKICSGTVEGSQGVIVEIILGRPLFSSFLTTTLPTVMLIIISQLATYFSKGYLDMVIQVNLTVLLVLATL